MLAADQETLVTFVEGSVSENAGSGVGATAVFGVEFRGAADGVVVGVVDSSDHSSLDDCISGVPVPNDMDAV